MLLTWIPIVKIDKRKTKVNEAIFLRAMLCDVNRQFNIPDNRIEIQNGISYLSHSK